MSYYRPPGYTQLPNLLLDEQAEMSHAELRVVLAVARQTFGWQKIEKTLSITDLQAMTGLSRQGTHDAVISAIERGTLKRKKQGSSYIYWLAVSANELGSEGEGANKTAIPLSGTEAFHSVERQTPSTNNGSKERKKETPLGDEVSTVFAYWLDTMGKNGSTKLTGDRRRKIEARLREGYTVDRIKRAVDGCAGSAFHRGENDGRRKHDDIELICRTGSKLEQFEAMPVQSQADQQEDFSAYTRPEN